MFLNIKNFKSCGCILFCCTFQKAYADNIKHEQLSIFQFLQYKSGLLHVDCQRAQ